MLVFALLLLLAGSSALAVDLCASLNAGDSSTLNVSTFQSNGLCQAHCQGYAYAVLLDKQCWCSNLTPAPDTQSDSGDCSDSCPVSKNLNELVCFPTGE